MSSPIPATITPLTVTPSHPWISWGAVIAGGVTAVAIQIALTELCMGLGLAAYEPTDPNSSAANVAAGTAIALLVSALIGIFAGGWVAGRMKSLGTGVEAAIHGAMVWAIGAILALVMTAISLGMLTGGAASLIGQGASGAAKGLGAAIPAVAQMVAPSWDSIKEQVEGVTAKSATSESQPAQNNDNRFAERSRLMQLLGQTFMVDAQPLADNDRQELTTLIASQMGISAEAARATLDQWQRAWNDGMRRFNDAKEKVKREAIEAATVAKRRTSQGAIIAFFVMIAGLGAAITGAVVGNACLSKDGRKMMHNPT